MLMGIGVGCRPWWWDTRSGMGQAVDAARLVGISVMAACALVLAACGAEVQAPAPDATTEAAGTPTPAVTPTNPEPTLVSQDLAGFEQRSVVFANIEFTVTAVRLSNQDLRSYASGGEPVIDAESFHAYLDVTAVNRMTATQTQGLGAGAFKSLLDGGEVDAADQMSFLSDVTGIIRPNVGVESFLAFPVPEDADLAGAVLVIGSPPDRLASLPLTGPVPEPAFPLAVEVTGSAQGEGPTNPGTVTFTLLGAALSEDVPHERATSPTGHRADAGELFLVLHVRAEKEAGRGPDLLNRDAFRLLVDDVPRAPWDVAATAGGSQGTPTLQGGAAVDAWVAFLVPVDAADLVLRVGRQADDPGEIPFDLLPLS
jgi:hypothetical protein